MPGFTDLLPGILHPIRAVSSVPTIPAILRPFPVSLRPIPAISRPFPASLRLAPDCFPGDSRLLWLCWGTEGPTRMPGAEPRLLLVCMEYPSYLAGQFSSAQVYTIVNKAAGGERGVRRQLCQRYATSLATGNFSPFLMSEAILGKRRCCDQGCCPAGGTLLQRRSGDMDDVHSPTLSEVLGIEAQNMSWCSNEHCNRKQLSHDREFSLLWIDWIRRHTSDRYF